MFKDILQFPSPFGVEGISTRPSCLTHFSDYNSFRLRLEWKVFQRSREGVNPFRGIECFRLRLEWKVFQQNSKTGTLNPKRVSVSVWSGRYFNVRYW